MPQLTRRNFIYSSILSLAGYSGLVEPAFLRVRQKALLIPNLPPAFEGFKIAQLTDFHYKAYNKGLIQRAVQKTNEWKPDLIALTGDFVDNNPSRLPSLLELLKPLHARLGSYAVLGNHDHHHPSGNIAAYRSAFAHTSTTLLVNECVTQEGVEIIGVDSICSSTPDFTLQVGGRTPDQLRLVLAHEPDMFDQIIPAYQPHLQLSGHTHGGQCRVPVIGYAPLTPRYGQKYKDGAFSKGPSSLFVSSGLGTSIAPIRFACLPEVALLTLLKLK